MDISTQEDKVIENKSEATEATPEEKETNEVQSVEPMDTDEKPTEENKEFIKEGLYIFIM